MYIHSKYIIYIVYAYIQIISGEQKSGKKRNETKIEERVKLYQKETRFRKIQYKKKDKNKKHERVLTNHNPWIIKLSSHFWR